MGTQQNHFPRRGFLKLGGGTALATLALGTLAACGNGGTTPGTTPANTPAGGQTTADGTTPAETTAAETTAAAGGPKTTIRFAYATGDDTWNAVVAALCNAFNAQSTTAEVRPDPLPPSTDYATALSTMDATGNWPAIVDMRETLTYVRAGKISPIPAEVTELLDENVYAAGPDGEVYTVPASALNGEIGLNMCYDKDYFAEHGLSVPTTRQEFIDLCEAIVANGDVPIATAAGDIWPSDQLWKPLAAEVFRQYPDGGGFWNAAVDGNASIEDLREELVQLQEITDKYVLPGWESTSDAQTATLLVTRAAVMVTSSAGLGRLNDINKVDPDFNVGLFITPTRDGKIAVLKNSVNGETAGGLAISTQAYENEAERAAATEFLKYYYSVDAANLMEETGMIAPNIKQGDQIVRNTSIPGAEDYFALLENPNLEWFENAPDVTEFGAFNTFFRQSRIEMQSGQTSLEECITKVQAELDKLERAS